MLPVHAKIHHKYIGIDMTAVRNLVEAAMTNLPSCPFTRPKDMTYSITGRTDSKGNYG